MNKKSIINILSVVLLFCVLAVVCGFTLTALLAESEEIFTVSIRVKAEVSDYLYLYSGSAVPEVNEDHTGLTNPGRYSISDMQKAPVTAGADYKTLTFSVKGAGAEYLMLKFGSRNNVMWYIKDITVRSLQHTLTLTASDLPEVFGETDGISKLSDKNGEYCSLKTIGTKPYAAVTEGSPLKVTKTRPTVFFLAIAAAILIEAAAIFVIHAFKAAKFRLSAENICMAVALSVIAVSPFIYGVSALTAILLTALGAAALLVMTVIRIVKMSKPVKLNIPAVLTSALIIAVFASGAVAALCNPDFYSGAIMFELSDVSEYSGAVQTAFTKSNRLEKTADLLYETLKTEVLGDSLNENVIIGKESWLFPSNTLSDYKKTNSFSSDTLKDMIDNIELYDKIMFNNGAIFYFMPVPDKMTVYSEYMPDNIKISSRSSRIDGVYLDFYKYSDIRVVEIKDKLIEKAASDDGLYYKADDFWTQKGAYVAIDTLETYIMKDFDTYEPLDVPTTLSSLPAPTGLADIMELTENYKEETEAVYFTGTEGMTVTVGRTDDEGNAVENVFSFSESVSDMLEERGEEYQLNDYFVIDNPAAANDMTAVIMRDEDAFSTVPFYCRMFTKCIVTTDRNARTQLLTSLEPDIVIYEVSERNLGTIAG